MGTISIALPTDANNARYEGAGLYLPAGDRVGSTDYAVPQQRIVNGLARPTSTPTLSVAGAYATGDYIGPTTSPASFTSVVRDSNAPARIRSLTIIDKTVAAAVVAMELHIFSATFTAPTDNAAWAISDADALLCQAVIEIPTTKWYASSNNRVFSSGDLNYVVQPAATTLFYALVARGSTPTWASGDLVLSLGVSQS